MLEAAGGARGLIAFARDAAPADFARHAARLAEAPGDPAAAAILAEADAWIARYIDHLSEGLALPLVFLGGLGPLFAGRLARRYGTRIRTPMGSALDGATWMAIAGDGEDGDA